MNLVIQNNWYKFIKKSKQYFQYVFIFKIGNYLTKNSNTIFVNKYFS